MPKLAVWMIRASLINMGIGFLCGAMLLFHKGIALYPWIWKLLNPHIELMIFGWTMQLIMGVAFFILPRFSHRKNRYGAEYLGWWSFFFLNAGVCLTAIAYFFSWYIGIVFGQLLVLFSVLAFIVMIWSRVKPFAPFTTSQNS